VFIFKEFYMSSSQTYWLENELRLLLHPDHHPRNIAATKISTIRQGYIYPLGGSPHLRVRLSNTDQNLTADLLEKQKIPETDKPRIHGITGKFGKMRVEVTTPIAAEFAQHLLENQCNGHVLWKTRTELSTTEQISCFLPSSHPENLHDFLLHFDEIQKPFGFSILEIERNLGINSLADLKTFDPAKLLMPTEIPPHCLVDITEAPWLGSRDLARIMRNFREAENEALKTGSPLRIKPLPPEKWDPKTVLPIDIKIWVAELIERGVALSKTNPDKILVIDKTGNPIRMPRNRPELARPARNRIESSLIPS
jgi:hypothetical protein